MAIAIIYAFAVVAGFVSLTSHVMDGRVRNTLGFVNVNAAALFFFSLLLLLAKERRRAWMVNCGVALAFVFLFILTNTRSLLLGAGVYYASYILFRFMGKGKTPSRLRGAVGLMVLYTLIVIAFSLPLLAGTEFDQSFLVGARHCSTSSWRNSLHLIGSLARRLSKKLIILLLSLWAITGFFSLHAPLLFFISQYSVVLSVVMLGPIRFFFPFSPAVSSKASFTDQSL